MKYGETSGKVIAAMRKRYDECHCYTTVRDEFGYNSISAVRRIILRETYTYIDDDGNDTRTPLKTNMWDYKLKDGDVLDIRRNCKRDRIAEYAGKYNVARSTISAVLDYKIHNYEALRV